MFNLLPTQQKEVVFHNYQWRRRIVGLALATAVAGIGFFALLPSLFLATEQKKAVIREAELAEQAALVREQSDVTTIVEITNEKMDALSPPSDANIPPTSVIRPVLVRRPTGISITTLLYGQTEDEEDASFIVRGVAQDRASLTAFSDALEQYEGFASANVPISEFVEQSDIPFTMTIALSNSQQ